MRYTSVVACDAQQQSFVFGNSVHDLHKVFLEHDGVHWVGLVAVHGQLDVDHGYISH